MLIPPPTAARVAIDLSFGHRMTGHEQKSLAQQLLRCYGANKKHRSPLSLHLTAVGLARSQFPACLPPPEHLARWERDEFVAIMDPPANALWPGSTLCWLSPDAEETLEAPLKDNAVYVLGGLVDRSVDKGPSLSRRARKRRHRSALSRARVRASQGRPSHPCTACVRRDSCRHSWRRVLGGCLCCRGTEAVPAPPSAGGGAARREEPAR